MRTPLFTVYADRIDAAHQLAARLRRYQYEHPIIFAIPRGAVPMGRVLADELHAELDVVLVHKLRAPLDPEFALGAIDEYGHTSFITNATITHYLPSEVNGIVKDELAELRRKRQLYTPERSSKNAFDRVAIVVDDGIATGSTMAAALKAVRAMKPKKLVCAVPVAARDSLLRLKSLADEMVCLNSVEHFGAVSLYYRHFPQVTDQEVITLLSLPSSVPPPT